MYRKFFKRLIDIVLSLIAIIIFSPILLVLSIIGAIKIGGNPFFFQKRPGKNEKIFSLIKFRTMDNRKDENGKLLPDVERLTKFGQFLRSTSLDELPELLNILKGDMSIVGPRPLMPRYLDYYTEEEKKRHNVRPGLTGLAQVYGRNKVTWDRRFELDLQYINNISLKEDIKIIWKTIEIVIKREGTEVADLKNLDECRGKRSI